MTNDDILRWAAERRSSLGRRERVALTRFYIDYGSHPDRTGPTAIEDAERAWEENSPAVKEILFLREVLAKIRDGEAPISDLKEAARLALEYCETF